jgi:hypothetical protein
MTNNEQFLKSATSSNFLKDIFITSLQEAKISNTMHLKCKQSVDICDILSTDITIEVSQVDLAVHQ